ncbi:MAG TPA: MaoC family dehydratase [Actinobacteria bacterium]|nr:MaoC family dehydratase [Actinomycetota bacterium]
MKTVPIDELVAHVGEDLGTSEWFVIDQARIDAFADATLDHQYIHVDPEAAKRTPWGTTIAHGFLTLSLLPHLMDGVMIAPEGTVMGINYGLDKVRFLEAVKVDSAVRAHVRLVDVTDKGAGRWLLKTEVTVEIRGADRPALVAEPLTMFVVA